VAVELQVGRSYRFRYLVDGQQWLNEWHADGWVDNSYGSADSVVDLTCFGQVQRTSQVRCTWIGGKPNE
jgi:hypothetical protein